MPTPKVAKSNSDVAMAIERHEINTRTNTKRHVLKTVRVARVEMYSYLV